MARITRRPLAAAEPIENGIDAVWVPHGARDIEAVFGEDARQRRTRAC
jgi:hypothetical protein